MKKIHQYNLEISEEHLDYFGHVNNAVYLTLYEQARWDLLIGNGFGLTEIQKIQKGPIILNLQLSFKKELVNKDQILIETFLPEIRQRMILRMEQIMTKKDGTIASTLSLNFGMMDFKSRKLVRPTDQFCKAIGM